LKPKASEQVKEFFRRASIAERVLPVYVEMVGMLSGRQQEDGDQKALPEYCYRIFEILNRTLFKVMATLAATIVSRKEIIPAAGVADERKRLTKIDWGALGTVAGVGKRALRFVEGEAEAILKKEGLLELSEAESNTILETVIGDREGQDREPGPSTESGEPVDKIAGGTSHGLLEAIKASLSALQWFAGQSGSEAEAAFHAGMADGIRGFLDAGGGFAGASTRLHTYLFLLIAWREVKELQDSLMGKTRKDLVELMKPFGALGIVNPLSEDQLADVCDEIGLKIKGRGRPKKSG
jgi:hypothetical protein